MPSSINKCISKLMEEWFIRQTKDDQALFLSIDMEDKHTLIDWVDSYLGDEISVRLIVEAIIETIEWDELYEWAETNLYLC